MIRFLMWLLGHVTVMNNIVVDKDYAVMKKGDIGDLYCRVVIICNGSNLVDPSCRSGKKTMFSIPQLL